MEDKFSLFQKFLITENAQINISDLLINSLVVLVLSVLLELTYVKCARSLSNRKMFASNFLLISFTTMLIISIVKSSLALSLGLVGALSIVRFRSAIKEPEELAYLFFAIAIGLGLGANQVLIVVIAFAIVALMLWAKYFISRKDHSQNLFLTISSNQPAKLQVNDVVDMVNQYFKASELKRFDSDQDMMEAQFLLESKKTEQIQAFKAQMQSIDESIRITFIDNKSL